MHISASSERSPSGECTGCPTAKYRSACEIDTPNVSAATDAAVSALTEGGFDYALIGGLAVILRGHDRYTRDVDALVWNLDDRLDELSSLLEQRGFRRPTPDELRTSKSTRLLHALWKPDVYVDFMLGFFPFERETLDHATPMDLGHGGIAKVATPEDLIIMKLTASREKDIQDVIALKELYPDLDRNRIRAIVSDYAEALERPDITENLDKWFK